MAQAPLVVWTPNNGSVTLTSALLAALLSSTPAAVSASNFTATGTLAVTGLSTLTGGATLGGPLSETATNAITAGTTHTLVGATPLTSDYNHVTVCANAQDAVALPAATPGRAIVVFNDGAAAGKVWPQAADTIDGGSAGVAVTLTNTKRCIYYCFVAGAWVSAQLGVASA